MTGMMNSAPARMSVGQREVAIFWRVGKCTPSGSRHLPPGAEGPKPTFELLFKGAREPGPAELAANPRARSAKLRAGVRTAAPAWSELTKEAA